MSEHKHLKLSHKRVQKVRPRFVRRWHRRLGLLSALAVLLLSLTGLLLNHVSQVYPTNSYVSAEWLLDWYGVPVPAKVVSYQEGYAPSIVWADGTVLINQKPALFNQGELLGIYPYNDILHLFTSTNLHLFSQSGEFIESIKLADGPPIKSVYTSGRRNVIVVQSIERFFDIDLDDFVLGLSAGIEIDSQSLAAGLKLASPEDEESSLARRNLLLKSTVLLDLHSGRFLGFWGVLLMDFFALCFLLLAISGIVAWRRGLARY